MARLLVQLKLRLVLNALRASTGAKIAFISSTIFAEPDERSALTIRRSFSWTRSRATTAPPRRFPWTRPGR